MEQHRHLIVLPVSGGGFRVHYLVGADSDLDGGRYSPIGPVHTTREAAQDAIDACPYKPETVARIHAAASQPAVPLPDHLQGDPAAIHAYLLGGAEFQDGTQNDSAIQVVIYDDMTGQQQAIVDAGLGPTREIPADALVDDEAFSTWLHGAIPRPHS